MAQRHDGTAEESSFDKRDALLTGARGESDTFSRPDALGRFKREYGTPIPVSDDEVILSVQVEYGRGIGAEPCGYWVEKLEEIVSCPECGTFGARRSFNSNSGQHLMESIECNACGHTEESF
jgi:hypothetical protein